ncbi:MAG: hypothetical protein V1806_16385 [Pseudomonadota bacterium]
MLFRLLLIACLVLLLNACAAGVTPAPLAGPPFGQAPPAAAEGAGHGPWWVFLAGLGLGTALAVLGRRRLLDMALRHVQGRRLSDGDAGRLRLVLALLEDLIISAGRRGVVVRLGDWLRAKGRGPGDKL